MRSAVCLGRFLRASSIDRLSFRITSESVTGERIRPAARCDDGLPLARGDAAPTITVRGISSELALPYADSSTVLFFYPTNQGSTCVTEIVDFDRRLAEFAALGAKLAGVSTEVISEAAALKDSRRLSLALCHDPHGEASALYGVRNAYGFSDRYTFLISKKKVVLDVWQAYDTVGHAEEVLRRCRSTLLR